MIVNMGTVTLQIVSVGDEPIREIASVWAMLPTSAKNEAIKKAEKFRKRVRNLSWDASLAAKFHATLANLNGQTPELSVLRQRLEQAEEAIERTGMVREPGSANCRQEYRQRVIGEVDYVVLDCITATILIDYFRRNAEPQLPEDDESGELFESLKRLGKVDTTENLAGSLVLHRCHTVALMGNGADLRTLGEILYLNWPGCITRVCEVLRKSFKRRPKNLPPLISKWMSKIDDIHLYTTNNFVGAGRHETGALADEPPFDAATESTPIVAHEKTQIEAASETTPEWKGLVNASEIDDENRSLTDSLQGHALKIYGTGTGVAPKSLAARLRKQIVLGTVRAFRISRECYVLDVRPYPVEIRALLRSRASGKLHE